MWFTSNATNVLLLLVFELKLVYFLQRTQKTVQSTKRAYLTRTKFLIEENRSLSNEKVRHLDVIISLQLVGVVLD